MNLSDVLINTWAATAQKNNCDLNPDKYFIERILGAFAKMYEENGECFCPCVFPPYTKEDVCPCSRLPTMLAERGRCHCNLFWRRDR